MIIYTLQQNCKTFKLMVNLAPIKKKMLIMRFKRLDKYFLKKKKKKNWTNIVNGVIYTE